MSYPRTTAFFFIGHVMISDLTAGYCFIYVEQDRKCTYNISLWGVRRFACIFVWIISHEKCIATSYVSPRRKKLVLNIITLCLCILIAWHESLTFLCRNMFGHLWLV